MDSPGGSPAPRRRNGEDSATKRKYKHTRRRGARAGPMLGPQPCLVRAQPVTAVVGCGSSASSSASSIVITG